MRESEAADGELLQFGSRRRLPPRVVRSAVAVGAAVALLAAGVEAGQPRVEAGHGSIAATPVAPSGHSSTAAVGSTVRGYYLR